MMYREPSQSSVTTCAGSLSWSTTPKKETIFGCRNMARNSISRSQTWFQGGGRGAGEMRRKKRGRGRGKGAKHKRKGGGTMNKHASTDLDVVV